MAPTAAALAAGSDCGSVATKGKKAVTMLRELLHEAGDFLCDDDDDGSLAEIMARLSKKRQLSDKKMTGDESKPPPLETPTPVVDEEEETPQLPSSHCAAMKNWEAASAAMNPPATGLPAQHRILCEKKETPVPTEFDSDTES
eukprot:7780232-Pyramimonas_sp.AAC.1